MIRRFFPIALLVASSSLAVVGCAPNPYAGMNAGMGDQDRMMKKQELMMKMTMGDTSVPAWYDQREKLTLALGDRVFDKPFDRVFDSVTVALANLGSNVNNMERQSGYITTAAPRLDPRKEEQLRKAAMVDFAKANGYDPKLLEKQGPYEPDLESMAGGKFARMGQQMTISLVRQGPEQTKVKIRFSNVDYPRELEEYYKTVWPAIDKQIFLDRNLD
jgi:hypothetical protein